jgi:hypothetical protein
VSVEVDDRRSFLTSASNTYSGTQDATSAEYFKKLRAVDYKHVAHYLYTYDLSNFNPRAPPSTDYMRFQKLLNFDSAVAWVEKEFRETNGFLFNENGQSCERPKRDIYQAYCNREGAVKHKATVVEPLFWKVFGRIVTLKKGRESTGKRMHTVKLPDLATARLEFESFVKEIGRWNWNTL